MKTKTSLEGRTFLFHSVDITKLFLKSPFTLCTEGISKLMFISNFKKTVQVFQSLNSSINSWSSTNSLYIYKDIHWKGTRFPSPRQFRMEFAIAIWKWKDIILLPVLFNEAMSRGCWMISAISAMNSHRLIEHHESWAPDHFHVVMCSNCCSNLNNGFKRYASPVHWKKTDSRFWKRFYIPIDSKQLH